MELSKKDKKAAQAFARLGGLKGGKARAEALTPEERQKIAREAANVRWAREKEHSEEQDIPKAIRSGVLTIGDMSIPCAVLNVLKDGVVVPIRVLSENGITNALLGSISGASKRRKRALQEQGAPIPLFLAPERLSAFISEDLMHGPLKPIIYQDGKSTENGFDAQILPIVCDIWLKARDAGALQDQQLDKAKKAEILMRGLAHVGIIALVDEATGYQYERARQALEEILEKFISNELRRWVPTFPNEFYDQVCRLKGWRVSEIPGRRTMALAKVTIDLVYERLAPNLYPRLKKIQLKNEQGRPKHKLWQRLSEDIGDPKLREHLASEITLMRVFDARCWDDFYKALNRALPRQVYLPLFDATENEANSMA
jgi:hypothetical protein